MKICLILYDQLSASISSLKEIDKQTDQLLFIETQDQFLDVPHHLKKIAFILSSMRHFADELRSENYQVTYVKMDDSNNSQNFDTELRNALNILKPTDLIITEPGNYQTKQNFSALKAELSVNFKLLEDSRFLASKMDFVDWAKGKKQLRMEYFYRIMRKKYQILIDSQGKPVGGEWNYDTQNREAPEKGMKSPARISHKKDDITNQVIELVKNRFPNNFGTLENFYFSVTRKQALIEAHHFITELLPLFGKYQDAMVAGEAYLYHSLLSSYLNIGLILPLELCRMAEDSYKSGKVALNSAEGFIRQILGWREYIRGIYWQFMPGYKTMNYLNAKEKLPNLYWGSKTNMACVSEAVAHTKEHAYSHHIQRLMVTGNFALIAGINPEEVCDWYLAVYADAHEWVELPNTLGMALFGDGGIVASKAYASSGKYIQRMSNFCDKCYYDPNKLIGENACPFNSLYWNFIARNEQKFRSNQRMTFVYSTWDKFSKEKQQQIYDQAKFLVERMNENKI